MDTQNEPSQTAPEQNITIPLRLFLLAIFNARRERFFVATADQYLHECVAIEEPIAKWLAALDPQETLIHIQAPWTDGNKGQHHILWQIDPWKRSYQRYIAIREEQNRWAQFTAKRNDYIIDLVKAMNTKHGTTYDTALDLAIELVMQRNYRYIKAAYGIDIEELPIEVTTRCELLYNLKSDLEAKLGLKKE